jgi:hypothetical protein
MTRYDKFSLKLVRIEQHHNANVFHIKQVKTKSGPGGDRRRKARLVRSIPPPEGLGRDKYHLFLTAPHMERASHSTWT